MPEEEEFHSRRDRMVESVIRDMSKNRDHFSGWFGSMLIPDVPELPESNSLVIEDIEILPDSDDRLPTPLEWRTENIDRSRDTVVRNRNIDYAFLSLKKKERKKNINKVEKNTDCPNCGSEDLLISDITDYDFSFVCKSCGLMDKVMKPSSFISLPPTESAIPPS